MDNPGKDLTYRERKVVVGLANSVRTNLPAMIALLNEASNDGEDVWQHIEALGRFFEKYWDANAQQGLSQPTHRNAHPAQLRK